jgi:hypothetical protein
MIPRHSVPSLNVSRTDPDASRPGINSARSSLTSKSTPPSEATARTPGGGAGVASVMRVSVRIGVAGASVE